MMNALVRRGTVAALVALSIGAVPRPAESAQQARQAPGQELRQPAQAPPPAVPAAVQPLVRRDMAGEEMPPNAEQTRRALRRLLTYYSPSVARVLALDPLLIQNPTYLEPYPDLVAFLSQHPEVGRNAAYYLSEVRYDFQDSLDKDTQVLRMWSSLFEGFTIFLVFGIVTAALVWLVKTLVDYRRWYRLSKVQTDVHNKLLDRFTANDDLMAYIATPAGKRFLESAPIMLDPSTPSFGGPMRRILWAIEIGLVVASGGGGLLISKSYVPAELGPPLSVVSIVGMALGVGFILAAAASYLLSWRMGLLGSAAARSSRDSDAHPAA